jgi:hypothetical protein
MVKGEPETKNKETKENLSMRSQGDSYGQQGLKLEDDLDNKERPQNTGRSSVRQQRGNTDDVDIIQRGSIFHLLINHDTLNASKIFFLA